MPFLNVFCPLRLTSTFDPALLQRSVNDIVQRHEILRTTFTKVDGECVQVIAPELCVELPVEQLDALPRSKREMLGHLIIQEEALHSFNLTEGPLFRIRVVGLRKREHLLLITMHGIIVDGWSLGVLIEEIFTTYDALCTRSATPLAPLSIQFADFAHWQRRWQSHPDIAAQLAYWREQLRDPLPVMTLAVVPPTRSDTFRTARRGVTLSANLTEGAKLFSLREGGTLYMALVAALKTVLQRYLGQDDLRVATLVANRNRPGIDGLVGPVANTVVLRTNLVGDPSLREVLRRVRTTALAAFAHQELPFEELVDTLERERPDRPLVLAQVMIALHNITLRPRMNSRHVLTFEEANPNVMGPLLAPTTYDLCLMLRETPHGVTGSCVYKPHLLDDTTVDQLLQDFQEVLQQMAPQPEQPLSAIRLSLGGKPS